MSRLIVGHHQSIVSSVKKAMEEKAAHEVDILVIPLFHPRLRRDNDINAVARPGPQTRSDRELSSYQWTHHVVGFVSDWIDIDSADPDIRLSSTAALSQELSWAAHLSLQAVIIPEPSFLPTCYAQALLQNTSNTHLWLTIPFTAPLSYKNTFQSPSGESLKDGWVLWDRFREFYGHSPRLFVALELLDDNPEELCGEFLTRWAAEPVRALIVNTRTFFLNSAGYPVLSAQLQKILCFFFQFDVYLIIRGRESHGAEVELKHYCQYIRHLKTRSQKPVSEAEKCVKGYEDSLQIPLQPLMDNLESQTYEVFARDPIKYYKYGQAMLKFLLTRRQEAKEGKPPVIVIAVVGAGRGPLVEATLRAATTAGVSVRVYVLEKNPNAIITLLNRAECEEEWGNAPVLEDGSGGREVIVMQADMRTWVPPEPCDVMFSELLGSFGDNELSPECLDGAQRCLKPNGISIPHSYTSFLAPVACARLWMGARDILPDKKGLDTFFVVKFRNYFQFCEEKPCFVFTHPQRGEIDNRRFTTVSFESTASMRVHGFAGYFHSGLFADEDISICPHDHTPDMFSWFPLFIPLRCPLRVDPGDVITIHMWRCVSEKNVWYEWCLVSPVITEIQNSKGQAYSVGL